MWLRSSEGSFARGEASIGIYKAPSLDEHRVFVTVFYQRKVEMLLLHEGRVSSDKKKLGDVTPMAWGQFLPKSEGSPASRASKD